MGSVSALNKITQGFNESPASLARKRAVEKYDSEALCFSQFPPNQTKEQALLKKATNLVRHDLIKRGVSSKEIVSPKTLTHFHINAIDDQVMYKLYQTSLIDQTNKSKPMGLNKDNFRSEIGQRHMDKIVLGFGNDIIPEELFSNTDG